MRPQKISTDVRIGNRGICQLVCRANLRKTIFDTFRLPYTNVSIDRDLPFVLLIPLLNLYAVMDGTYTIKRLMSISHIEQVL